MQNKVINVPGVAGQCPACHHPPIRHVPDGTGATCTICAWLAGQALEAAANRERFVMPGWNGHVCTLRFVFKLSRREREQAERADKGSYPPKTVCAVCDCTWEAHAGYLCPTGDSVFIAVLDKDLPFVVTH
jgi:hypothetical protein